jgi:hypothetical protein
MKKNAVSLILGVFFALFIGITASMAADASDVVGTWKYNAPDAPYEYSSGKIIIAEEGSKLTGTIKIDYYSIEAEDVKFEKNILTFGAYIEGEYVQIKVDIDGKKFSGQATYSEGSLPVSGEKQ